MEQRFVVSRRSMPWFITHSHVTVLVISLYCDGKEVLAGKYDDVSAMAQFRRERVTSVSSGFGGRGKYFGGRILPPSTCSICQRTIIRFVRARAAGHRHRRSPSPYVPLPPLP